jgi:hypothetical protein
MAKIGNAGLHHVQIHFDEAILDAARLRSGEDPFPIEGALPHRCYFPGFRRPALHVHGNESTRVFGKAVGSVVALADRRDLKLELDELRIEKTKQQVVRAPAVDRRQLKTLIMKSLLDAGLGRLFTDPVVFVGRPLHIPSAPGCAARRGWARSFASGLRL